MTINLSKKDLLDMGVAFQKNALEKGTGEYCKIDGNISSIKNFLIDSSGSYGTELNISGKYGDFIVGSESSFTFKDGIGNVSQNAEGLTLSGINIIIGKLGDSVSIIVFKYQDNTQSGYSFITNNINADEYKNTSYCTGNLINTAVQEVTKPIEINQNTNYILSGIILLLLILVGILSFKIYKGKK